MRATRSFRPVLEVMGTIALCSGIAVVAVGPLPELGGAPAGGFLEGPGGGIEPVDTTTGVDLGLAGIDQAAGDVTPHAVNPVDDFDALYAAVHPTDPTPVTPAGAFD